MIRNSLKCSPLDSKAVLLVGEWSNIPFNVVAPAGSLKNIFFENMILTFFVSGNLNPMDTA